MLIGVISDIHLRDVDERLRNVYENIFSNIELLIHCGDATSMKVIKYLSSKFQFKGVHGNMDDDEVKKNLPEKIVVEVGGKKIGIVHGWGAPFGITGRVRKVFEGELIDAIFFGHSHVPYNDYEDNIYFFNPGAFATGWFTKSPSVGIVEIREGKFYGKHIPLRDK